MLSEVHEGIQYRCFSRHWRVYDLSFDELWEMFEVRWLALSEERFDKDLDTFLLREPIDLMSTTVQVAAIAGSGQVVGGLRVHIAQINLLEGIPGVQISRVGVHRNWRGRGIGRHLVDKAVRIAADVGRRIGLGLIFLLGRVAEGEDPSTILRFYERAGFQRTNLFTETKGLLNCLMLMTWEGTPREYLSAVGFSVTEVEEAGALRPVLHIGRLVL